MGDCTAPWDCKMLTNILNLDKAAGTVGDSIVDTQTPVTTNITEPVMDAIKNIQDTSVEVDEACIAEPIRDTVTNRQEPS
jgi:RNA-binding protein YlmH